MKRVSKEEKIGIEVYNKQGCLMKCIDYINDKNTVIEFVDDYRYTTTVRWGNFIRGSVKNPYCPSVYGVGISGINYTSSNSREYLLWSRMIQRCYDPKLKNNFYTYENVTCCKEWLLFDNFLNWLTSQDNYEQLCKYNDIELDKDILIKNNKIYSPETCCLVSHKVNCLFLKG